MLWPMSLLAVDMQVIDTEVFTIELPQTYKIIEEKNQKYLFAHSKDNYDGWPTEMVIIDYCKIDGKPKEANTLQCNACSEEKFIELLKLSKTQHGPFEIEKSINQSTTEYRAGKISEGGKISILKCNQNGQIHMILGTSKKATKQFVNISQSVKLK